MFYAKLNEDGTLDRYPYTLTDLRRENPGTSFPEVITDDLAASFGVVPVVPADEPAYDYTVDLTRTAQKKSGQWVEVWETTPASPEEIAQRTSVKADEIRRDRNRRLADCDWTQLADSPLTAEDKAAWASYRSNLRLVPQQSGFPWNVTWPEQPSQNK